MAKTATATKKQEKAKPASDAATDLRKLFEDELKDIYWAEKALTKALPKMAKNASSEELVAAINDHLEVTKNQVVRLEQVFEALGKKAQAKKCDAMEGLIKEGEGIIEDTKEGPVRDAGIISACQKVEHYEIASYGTLAAFAKLLGETEAAGLLEQTLAEEKEADETLTSIAESGINLEASGEESEEEDDEDDTAEDDDDDDAGSSSATNNRNTGKPSGKMKQ
jgi:ferritin-like metal-binding protein YciE